MTGKTPQGQRSATGGPGLKKSLSAAQREFAAEAHLFAVNRSYYAAFYGASAALLERQRSFKKHSGVRAAFHAEFIRTGLLDASWGEYYDHLFGDRQKADYVALSSFEPAYVEDLLRQCSEFLTILRTFIPSLSESH
jgi:uncharacterized protein (UPF0332 family)